MSQSYNVVLGTLENNVKFNMTYNAANLKIEEQFDFGMLALGI